MRFYEKQFAEEFDRRLTLEGYPGKLLDAVEDEIKDLNTILDIGAGSGLLAIPLAQIGHIVTAVEPSSEMIRIFKSKLSQDISSRISIFQDLWEEWHGKKTEGLICIHSIYPMKDKKKAIQQMLKYADKRIMLVNMKSETLSDIIRKDFKKDKCSSEIILNLENILKDESVSFTTKEFSQQRETKFTDIDKEVEYYCYHLVLNETEHKRVKEIILHACERQGQVYSFKSIFNDRMIIF